MKIMRIELKTAIALAIAVLLLPVVMSGKASLQESTPAAEISTAHFSLHALDNPETEFFYDVAIQPGDTLELNALLVNWNLHPLTLRVYTTNAGNSPNGGFLAGGESDFRSGSTTWIDLSNQEITLSPEERVVIPFYVSVPEGTAPGQYISAIVAETAEAMPIPGEEVIEHRIRYAISVSILVPGERVAAFELGEPVVEGNHFYIPMTNTGNYLVRPTGEIVLTDQTGETVFSSPYSMGSVYAGIETTISFRLPITLPDDRYILNLTLTDPESGATVSLSDLEIEVTAAEEGPSVEVEFVSIVPNDGEFLFLAIDLELVNTGQQTATSVHLEVLNEGEVVDVIELVTNQIFPVGQNFYSTRFIPETPWKSGRCTFNLVVVTSDPGSDHRLVLLNEELDAEIVVP